jgi:hypothetical protein
MVIVLLLLLLVAALALRFGADTRDGRDWQDRPEFTDPRTW